MSFVTTPQELEARRVREMQAEEGRRLANQEEAPQPRRTLSVVSRPAQKKPQKAPLKGHHAFLKALELSSATIRLEKMSGDIVVGQVKHSDEYTVTIHAKDAEGEMRDRVIFKHDISEFSALTPKAEAA